MPFTAFMEELLNLWNVLLFEVHYICNLNSLKSCLRKKKKALKIPLCLLKHGELLPAGEASLLNWVIEHIDGFVSAKMSISALKSLMVVFDVLLISSVKFECCHWSGSGGGMMELNANTNSSPGAEGLVLCRPPVHELCQRGRPPPCLHIAPAPVLRRPALPAEKLAK